MKTHLNTILKSSFFLLCKNISGLGAYFLLALLLARYLGKEAFGLYALLSAVVMIFGIIVEFGQSASLVHELSRKERSETEIIKNTIFLKTLLTVIAGCLLFGFSYLYFDGRSARSLIWIFGLVMLPRGIYSTFETAFITQGKSSTVMGVALAAALLLVPGSWIMLKSGFGLSDVILFLLTLETVKAGIAWLIYGKVRNISLFRNGMQVDQALCRNLVKNTVPYFILGLIGTTYIRVDIMLLDLFKGTAEVGVYGAASSFVKVAQIVPSVIVASFFPVISRLDKDSPMLRSLTLKTLQAQLGVGFVLSLALYQLSGFLVWQTFGFPESGMILGVLVWTIMPFAVYSTLIYAFFRFENGALNIKILLSALILNVLFNLILIPYLSAMALAISKLISETFCAILFFTLFHFRSRTVKIRGPELRVASLEKEISEISLN